MANLTEEKELFFYQPDIRHGAAGANKMQFIFCEGCP
jgi:hypothetical protein